MKTPETDIKAGFFRKRLRLAPNSKGISIIELVIACLVIVTGILTLVSCYGLFTAFSAKSRNRVYAEIMAKSMIDRIRAHTYGDPEPFNWNGNTTITLVSEVPVAKALAAKSVTYENFEQSVAYANGSFVGKAKGNYDTVTVTIRWMERKAGGQYAGQGGNPQYTTLKAVVEVRNSIADQQLK
ncbi:MAG: hypothetical protein LWY06_10095 [Firmicutes bacterium]|nr:hypothetical protein [Bacillota bacterium]